MQSQRVFRGLRQLTSRRLALQPRNAACRRLTTSVPPPTYLRHRTFHTYPPRCDSSTSTPATTQSRNNDSDALPRNEPAYELSFTCKPCSHRSQHRISKHGYHRGTVLITCPSCKNRHIISDHLKIFSDTTLTIEQIMKEKGEMVKRGTLGADGDMEYWDDGTTTNRKSES